jgi:hypothetical protein
MHGQSQQTALEHFLADIFGKTSTNLLAPSISLGDRLVFIQGRASVDKSISLEKYLSVRRNTMISLPELLNLCPLPSQFLHHGSHLLS